MSESIPGLTDFARQPWSGPIPLSFEQERVWFTSELGQSQAYHIPFAWALHGRLDVPALDQAICDVLERHESLRTVFPAVGGMPRQVVRAAASVLSTAETDPAALPAVIAEFGGRRFDLSADLPVRMGLFTTTPEVSVLMAVFHHIAVDGWSLAPLLRDLSQAYRARRQGQAPQWVPLPLRYSDYARWQREIWKDEADPDSWCARQLAFWKTTLADLPDEAPLPASWPENLAAGPGDSGMVDLEPDAEVHRRMVVLARECKASIFMVGLAVWSGLLSRLGAGPDVAVGTPVAGRSEPGLTDIVGFCANTLALRTDTSGDPSLRELLGQVRGRCLDALRHQVVPFDRVVRALNPPRVLGRHPLFQTMFTLTHGSGPGVGLTLDGIRCAPERVPMEGAKFDLSLELHELHGGRGPAGLAGLLRYSGRLFDRPTAEWIAQCWTRFLAQAVLGPDRPLSRLDMLGDELRQRLLQQGRGADCPVPRAVLPELFEAQVRRAPDRVALAQGTSCWSYAQLNQRANELARWLIGRGAGPGGLVAIRQRKSLECVAALWGVLKAGAAFVPVDPDYPAERIRFFLQDASPVVVLTGGEGAGQPARPDPGDADRVAPLHAGDLAYVLYTSGSTGGPKGVMVEHRQVIGFLDSITRAYAGLDGASLASSPISFDMSIVNMFAPLLRGGCVHLTDLLGEDAATLQALGRFPVTFASVTPSHLPLLTALPAPYSPSRDLVVGGEALVGRALDEWRASNPDVIVRNSYGPTETTVSCAEWRIDPGQSVGPGSLPIGRPLPNTRLYVLDQALALVPSGVAGELHIAGAGVTRGYLRRPVLTAQRFVPDPFGPPGSRMYRTGDLVRWRADGCLEFLRRIDDQVKVRGRRIELAEVTAALLDHPRVSQAAVLLREDQPGDQRLVAYVVPDGAVEAGPLRDHAARTLPDYMVPASIVLLPALPVTASGKLDQAALPRPQRARQGSRQPRDARERAVTRVFAEVLGLPEVGPDDNFFELGGHSLLAARLLARLRAEVGAEFPLHAVFLTPTPASLAASLAGDIGPRHDPLGPLFPVRPGGSEPAPLFCVHPVTGLAWCYTALLSYLPEDLPVWGLQARGLTGPASDPATLDAMICDYIERIRKVAGGGPYRLLGWSFGGVVAHAIATRLQRDGARVDFLALLDAYPHAIAAPRAASQPPVPAGMGLPALAPGQPGALDEATTAAVTRVIASNRLLIGQFSPEVYHGQLFFVRAAAAPYQAPQSRVWHPYVAGPVTSHDVSHGHYELMSPEAVDAYGPALRKELERLPGAGR